MNTHPTPVRRGMSRRNLLRLGSAAATGVALSSLGACASPGTGSSLVLATTPDIAKNIKSLIARFNAEHRTSRPVKVRAMPIDSSQFFDQARTQLQAGATDIDVLQGDISWAAQFAPNGWLTDLSERFTPSARSQFLPEAVAADTVDSKVYGVPWFWDAGLLYYRKDLLERSGYTYPPETWDELQDMARKVTRDQRTKNGFIFQGADYEGGTVNGVEYIRSAGGDVLTGGKATVDAPKAVEGLRIQRSMVTSGVAPKAVATYKEDECAGLFLGGDAVFCRSWLYLYGVSKDKKQSAIDPSQIGIAELPVARAGLPRVNVGGGWNFLVNANSAQQDDAWKLVSYLAGSERQKFLATNFAYPPVRPGLYDDAEVLKSMPVVGLAKQAIKHTSVPPISPYYSDMSLAMAKFFNSSLRGAVSPEQAAEQLQGRLERIVAKG